MRKLVWVLALALAPGLAGQQDSAAPPDSGERERLQRLIEARVANVVPRQLRLTNDQAARLRATEERFRARRRDIVRRQLALRFALNGEMCPGCAAEPDSVRKLMDGIDANRGDLFRMQQEQDRELAGYLTPVQRAQYQMLRERLIRRLGEVRRERLQERRATPPVRRRRLRP